MNNYWTEGEDLDLFGDSEAIDDYYGKDIYGGDPEATIRDHRAQTARVQAARARGRGYSPPLRPRPRRPPLRPRPRRLDYFPQTPAAVQNIDDYDVGGIDDYDVGGIDDYDVGEDDYAELAEGLREVLHEDYEDAPPEEMQEALSSILETMTPAEGFNLGKAFRQVASTILPKAGVIVGTALGGPVVGTAIGGKLGQVAGQALSGRGKPSSAPAPANMATASPKDGSAAAAKVVELTQNPDVLKSLLALALGEHGKKSIPIGKNGQSVSVAAVVDLLNTFVGQAAKDAEELLGETDEMPAYLLDSEGNFRVDPVVPEDRAQALYQALFDAENQRLADEAALYSAYLEFDDESDVDDYDEEALDDFLY